jgi:hypothetical protein
VEPSGIGCCHFANNPKWQEAFDMVRNGADIPSLIALNPTCETARLWGLGIEMDADKMLSLARQIVASVRAEEAADEVAETAPKSSTVVEPENDHRAKAEVVDVSANRRSTTKPVSVTAADVVTAKVDAVLPDAQRRGITTKEPKLVPPTPARSRTPAGKLAEAMSFLRDELPGEVAAAEIETRARKAGIAIKTLKRARTKLRIVSRRRGFGRQGGMERSIVLVGCNGSTRLHNGACKSAGPRSSGERPSYCLGRKWTRLRPSYCLGRKWTRLPRLVANEFFRGRLSDPAFQTSEANLIEFIKARGRALDREQVSNGSLTHPPAISIPGNKAATGGLPIASVLNGSARCT